MNTFIQKLARDESGAMAIETAIVAPTLVMMGLGVFEVGSIVSRQHELQTAANEATMIVMAANQGPEVELSKMAEIIQKSIGLTDSQLTLSKSFRCNTISGKEKDAGACPTSAFVSEYVEIAITDTYTPTWTSFGIGKTISFSVDRSVQVA